MISDSSVSSLSKSLESVEEPEFKKDLSLLYSKHSIEQYFPQAVDLKNLELSYNPICVQRNYIIFYFTQNLLINLIVISLLVLTSEHTSKW